MVIVASTFWVDVLVASVIVPKTYNAAVGFVGGAAHVMSPLKNVVVLFGGVGTAPPCVASPAGKSVFTAIERAPVAVVLFNTPVDRAAVPAE